MFRKQNFHLALSLIAVFLFWFLLAKDNFFHMDDWEWVKLYQKGFWDMILTPRDGEHFVPLGGIVFYIFFKLFGFNYIPFQVFSSLIHALNALILYKITKLETRNPKLALAASILFSFASTAPDVLVWGNSLLISTAGFFYFLGFYCFLLFSKTHKSAYLLLSCLLLLFSPRFQTITTIAPFALAAVSCLRLKRNKTLLPVLMYVCIGIINIAVTLVASSGNVQAKTLMINAGQIAQIPAYIFTGIYKGTFLRLVNPELYLLQNITHITQPIRLALAFLLPIAAFFIFGQIRINRKLLWKQNTGIYFSYLILLTVTYIMVAPFRVHNGIMQASIPRYTYTSVFFLIILFTVLYDSLFGKMTKLVMFLFIVLLSLHIVADYNFNKNWHLNTEKDRAFTEDMKYLLANNDEVFDLPVDGIWVLKMSNLDTLLAPGKQITFSEVPFNVASSVYLKSDERTREIYDRLLTTYAVYNPPFHVPYSM